MSDRIKLYLLTVGIDGYSLSSAFLHLTSIAVLRVKRWSEVRMTDPTRQLTG